MAHLTRPLESITGGTGRLAIKWIGHAGVEVKANEKVTLIPRALFMSQARSTELTAGMLMYYRINEKDNKLLAGFDWRKNDALIGSLGITTTKYAFRVSYDINNSYLSTYLRNRGAFEISFIYIGEKSKPYMSPLLQF